MKKEMERETVRGSAWGAIYGTGHDESEWSTGYRCPGRPVGSTVPGRRVGSTVPGRRVGSLSGSAVDAWGARRPAQRSPGLDPSSASIRRRSPECVYRRRRALVGAVAAIVLLAGATVFGVVGGTGPAAGSVRPGSGPTWLVRSGESLWTIAEHFSGNGDPRPLVAELRARLGTDRIYPGELIELPPSVSEDPIARRRRLAAS